MKTNKKICGLIALILAGSSAVADINAVADIKDVKLVGGEGAWELRVNGKPYFVKGAGGDGDKALLASMGANSFRTWGADKAREQLETARSHGLSVALGCWLGHERHGFNYNDAAQLRRQTEEVRRVVETHKDHPALLMWALGNEMEIGCSNPEALWTHINDLAKMVKSIDPNHPVMTVIAEIPDEKVRLITRLCPDVDIIGINSYGGAGSVVERWRKAGGKKPVIVTEFGPPGHWETGSTLGMPNEPTSTEKGKWMSDVYRPFEAERGKSCLGSYAFTWGWKTEATPTWYGMLLPDNSILATAEAMRIAWGGPEPKNRVPRIRPLQIAKNGTDEFTAKASAADPDNDPLAWEWALIREAGNYNTGGDFQAAPPAFAAAIVRGQGTDSATVKLPASGGNFRLYAYVRDGKGGAAYANAPLQGEGRAAPAVAETRAAPRAEMPCAVYADGASPRWTASGYMGNVGAIKMDLDHAVKPHSGTKCIRVEYAAADNWGGVMWQSPANDWGAAPGGYDLEGATTLEFWAKGEKGGEKVSFQVGGIENAAYSDTVKAGIQDIVLKPEWTRYRIPLDGRDLSRVKTGFQWTLANPGRAVVFYLDDIRYVRD